MTITSTAYSQRTLSLWELKVVKAITDTSKVSIEEKLIQLKADSNIIVSQKIIIDTVSARVDFLTAGWNKDIDEKNKIQLRLTKRNKQVTIGATVIVIYTALKIFFKI